MAGCLHRCHFSYSDNNYARNDIWEIRQELEGWRELVLPLTSLLRWDKPYYPVIIVGATTIWFTILLYSDMSTVTAISLACVMVAVFDFAFLMLRPVICKYRMWTNQEDLEFVQVCETIACFRQDAVDSWHGLQALRRDNPHFFLLIMLLVLATTAWLGSIIDNFLLTYIIVNGLLLIPGMYHHRIGQNYTELVVTCFNTLSQMQWNSHKLH